MEKNIIKEIKEKAEKSAVCSRILGMLPNWFGNPKAVLDYTENVKNMQFYACYCENTAVGFAAVKVHNAHTAEVCVMGVIKEYHRSGIGKRLIAECVNYCRKQGYSFLTVKTLADLSPDEGYARTRAFYFACGFHPLEVFTEIWDERNPCLFMAMAVNPITSRPLCKGDTAFLSSLINEPEILSALHTDKTDITCWQSFFESSKQDEENFIICRGEMPCAWMKINGLFNSDKAWLSMLVVSETARRQGVGKYCIDFADRYIKAKGISKLGVQTTGDNIAALKLYEGKGYIVTDRSCCDDESDLAKIRYKFTKVLKSSIEYKEIKGESLSPHLLANFNRFQEVNRYYAKNDSGLTLSDCNFTEQWDEDKKQDIIGSDFKEVLEFGGVIFGAVDNGRLIGFGCVDGRAFGGEGQYLQLIYLHVSCEYRNSGIGGALFNLCAESARKAGAKKLYISAASYFETQSFYRKIGCVDVKEDVENFCDRDPYDIEMEYVL